MKVSIIRKKFIDFFSSKNHEVIPSSSLVPVNDSTLMFTNSGMVQFKDIFLGLSKPTSLRVTSVQRCLRAGGKHNDLENVGYTSRHHTFFEMLGNFSFGDYFKREAIHYAWELLTKEFGLPEERLLVTVYYQDFESFDIWTKEIGLPKSKVIQIHDNKGMPYASDNFWSMADTGPCGPSSEIFYDHGSSVSGGVPGSAEGDGERFVEIWNLVFMQYERLKDGSMKLLPNPCVDTGMGLERIAAVLQDVQSNYEIDLFQRLIQASSRITGCTDLSNNSLKVIADHIRASVFMIADGVVPSNEGRNYVLRRIMRRAIRHGYKLNCHKPFFSLLVDDCVQEMGQAYPILHVMRDKIQNIIEKEEIRFFETLSQGMGILDQEIKRLNAISSNKAGILSKRIFSGNIAFKLHDTYGFPLDLTEDICREHDFVVDSSAFEEAMKKQKELGRLSGKFNSKFYLDYDGAPTDFIGYEYLEASNAVVKAIYLEDSSSKLNMQQVNFLLKGQCGIILLDKTPFYAESGGQVGDKGELFSKDMHLTVESAFKVREDVIAHKGCVDVGKIYVGQILCARIDSERRLNVSRNHSATHLLHFALRYIIGDGVKQSGSLVDGERIRFDFSHDSPVSLKELEHIEYQVNKQILLNMPVKICWQSFDNAVSSGAIALFGEKYSEKVRVVQLGSSHELCCGTHVHFTGDIGLFKILSESGVAAGIRRIEAITGEVALNFIQKQNRQVREVSSLLNCSIDDLSLRLQTLLTQRKDLERKISQLTEKNIKGIVQYLKTEAKELGNIKIVTHIVHLDDTSILRNIALALLKDLGVYSLVVLAVEDTTGKGSVVVCVSEALEKKMPANQIIKHIITHSGGKGGGRTNLSQAGGVTISKLSSIFQSLDFLSIFE